MKLWYYSEGEKKSGPIEQQELIQLLKAGQLKPDIFVWSEGMAEWVMARSVDALNAAAFGSPPPLPKIKPSSKNPNDVIPKPTSKARPKFVAALFNDEVPLYAGLKRASLLIGLLVLWLLLFLLLDDDWDFFPAALVAIPLSFAAGRVPLWATKEFRIQPGSSQSKKAIRLLRIAKASWIITFIIGLLTFFGMVTDDWDFDDGDYYFIAILVWLGSLAVIRTSLWAISGFLGISRG